MMDMREWAESFAIFAKHDASTNVDAEHDIIHIDIEMKDFTESAAARLKELHWFENEEGPGIMCFT